MALDTVVVIAEVAGVVHRLLVLLEPAPVATVEQDQHQALRVLVLITPAEVVVVLGILA